MSSSAVDHVRGETIRACSRVTPVSTRNPWRGVARCAGRRAVFLDRDGTLIVDKPYNADPRQIELLPGVIDGLRLLRDAGYVLIVLTNQSGIARGYFSERDLASMHRQLDRLLVRHEIRVLAYYFCPHHVDGSRPELAIPCVCRKPAPGMIWRAAADWSIDLHASWLVGDRRTDVLAAAAAGCPAILIGDELPIGLVPRVPNLAEAARLITATAAPALPRAAAARRSAQPG